MNKLKRAERTRLKEILNELMLLYDITPSEKDTNDIRDLAQNVVDSWKKKKDALAPELRSAIDENYSRMFV